ENSRLTGDPTLNSVGTNNAVFKIERSLVLRGLLHRGFNSGDIIWMNSPCPILVFAAEASVPQTVKLLLRGRPRKLVGNEITFKRAYIGRFLRQLQTIAYFTQGRFDSLSFSQFFRQITEQPGIVQRDGCATADFLGELHVSHRIFAS